jgi:hypothetical protein
MEHTDGALGQASNPKRIWGIWTNYNSFFSEI